MFKVTSSSTGGIEVIFIILLGCLFLCQTLGKLIMWLIGKFRYTAFNGRDIIEELQKPNHLEKAKIKVKDFDLRSPFYSYDKRKNEFTINKAVADYTNLSANMFSLQSVAYANEKNNRSFQSRWQLMGVGLLSILPYLLFIGSMLLIYLPTPNANNKLDLQYYIPVEVFCVVGWVLILITVFWWMSIINNLEIGVEDLVKQLQNKNLMNNMNSYMKFCSYIPFSFRTIV